MPLIDANACVSILPRSGFAPCATIFPADDVITHPPPDCFLDFVLSVAILIGVPFWIHAARMSGYSRNICCNRCFFHNWRFLKYSMNYVGLGLLIVVSCEFTWMVNLFWWTWIGCALHGEWYYWFFISIDMEKVRWSVSLQEYIFLSWYTSRSRGEKIH